LTEMEMALKREETARKRKNLSEKKAEDERVSLAPFLFLRLLVRSLAHLRQVRSLPVYLC
jgi:PAPA-1-like conserved region